MKVNVWYHTSHDGLYRFASLYDECNYCYPMELYTLEGAIEAYKRDHADEGFEYNFISSD